MHFQEIEMLFKNETVNMSNHHLLLYVMGTGGLMQLVAYGAQDIRLTGHKDITFFPIIRQPLSLYAYATKCLPQKDITFILVNYETQFPDIYQKFDRIRRNTAKKMHQELIKKFEENIPTQFFKKIRLNAKTANQEGRKRQVRIRNINSIKQTINDKNTAECAIKSTKNTINTFNQISRHF